jgi:hypothetical protein
VNVTVSEIILKGLLANEKYAPRAVRIMDSVFRHPCLRKNKILVSFIKIQDAPAVKFVSMEIALSVITQTVDPFWFMTHHGMRRPCSGVCVILDFRAMTVHNEHAPLGMIP